MDDMMKIHLLIDNERYPMTIRREDEQLYRDAADVRCRSDERRGS